MASGVVSKGQLNRDGGAVKEGSSCRIVERFGVGQLEAPGNELDEEVDRVDDQGLDAALPNGSWQITWGWWIAIRSNSITHSLFRREFVTNAQ
jgi:hypothetical protein